jgi:hypothetical protein
MVYDDVALMLIYVFPFIVQWAMFFGSMNYELYMACEVGARCQVRSNASITKLDQAPNCTDTHVGNVELGKVEQLCEIHEAAPTEVVVEIHIVRRLRQAQYLWTLFPNIKLRSRNVQMVPEAPIRFPSRAPAFLKDVVKALRAVHVSLPVKLLGEEMTRETARAARCLPSNDGALPTMSFASGILITHVVDVHELATVLWLRSKLCNFASPRTLVRYLRGHNGWARCTVIMRHIYHASKIYRYTTLHATILGTCSQSKWSTATPSPCTVKNKSA